MPGDQQSAQAAVQHPFRRMTVLRYGDRCHVNRDQAFGLHDCGCALDLGALQTGPVTPVLVERPWSGCCVDRSQKVVLIAEPERRAVTSTRGHSDGLAITSCRERVEPAPGGAAAAGFASAASPSNAIAETIGTLAFMAPPSDEPRGTSPLPTVGISLAPGRNPVQEGRDR
jgi:hypothetical protein